MGLPILLILVSGVQCVDTCGPTATLNTNVHRWSLTTGCWQWRRKTFLVPPPLAVGLCNLRLHRPTANLCVYNVYTSCFQLHLQFFPSPMLVHTHRLLNTCYWTVGTNVWREISPFCALEMAEILRSPYQTVQLHLQQR